MLRLSLLCVVACAGCIKPPEIVLVDRATALEEQAAGSYAELETRIERAAATPRPVPLTPAQLQELGIRKPPLVDNTDATDADRLDQLLKQRCVGEARDGTLVRTREACQGAVDRDLVAMLIARTNLARAQLWRWMHDCRPQTGADELRRAWREAHLRGVVCEGWIETAAGSWEAKKC